MVNMSCIKIGLPRIIYFVALLTVFGQFAFMQTLLRPDGSSPDLTEEIEATAINFDDLLIIEDNSKIIPRIATRA